MKRFNVSILAVVAVLAIGLTAFTKAEPNAKRVDISNCYTDLQATTCPANVDLDINVTACNTALSQDDKAVRVVSTFVSTIPCDLEQQVFCCAQLERIAAPICPTQPLITFRDFQGTLQTLQYAKIKDVYCKSSL